MITTKIKVTLSGTLEGSDVEADIALSRTLADGVDVAGAAKQLREKAEALLRKEGARP